MAEDLAKLVKEFRELKRSVVGRSEERAFYQRVVFIMTLLAFVLGGVSFYFRTNTQLLETVEVKVREMRREFLPVGEGRRFEEQMDRNTEATAHISEALDELRLAISDLKAEVRVIRNELGSAGGVEDR